MLLFGGYRADAGIVNDLWVGRAAGERGWASGFAVSSGNSAPLEMTWHIGDALGAPPAPRVGHAAACLGAYAFVHGGFNGDVLLGDLHRRARERSLRALLSLCGAASSAPCALRRFAFSSRTQLLMRVFPSGSPLCPGCTCRR